MFLYFRGDGESEQETDESENKKFKEQLSG